MTPVVFAGSFDPITNGHVEMIRRAQAIFGAVVVLVMPNNKKKTLFSLQERKKILTETFKGDACIQIASAQGLLVDYMKKHQLTVLVRGVRNATDWEYENNQCAYNRLFYPQLQTVFLPSGVETSFISSSAVKEAFACGADVHDLVPPCVLKALKKKKQHPYLKSSTQKAHF